MGILRQITSTRCGIDGVTRTVNYIYGGVDGVVKRMNPNYMGYDLPITKLIFRFSSNTGVTNVASDNSFTADSYNISRSTASSTYGCSVSLSNNNHTFQVYTNSSTKGMYFSGYVYAIKSNGSEVQLTSNTTVSGVTSISVAIQHYYGGSGSSWYVTYWSSLFGTNVWNTSSTFTSWTSASMYNGVGLAYGSSGYSTQTINSVTVNGFSIPYEFQITVSGW